MKSYFTNPGWFQPPPQKKMRDFPTQLPHYWLCWWLGHSHGELFSVLVFCSPLIRVKTNIIPINPIGIMHISGAIPKMTIGWSGYPQMNIFFQLYMSLRFLFYPMFWPGVGSHQVILDWEILQRFHCPEFQQDSMMKNDPLRYFHHVDFFLRNWKRQFHLIWNHVLKWRALKC